MTTDSTWEWTILMAKGKIYHLAENCDILWLLERYQRDGNDLSEIEAIIRH